MAFPTVQFTSAGRIIRKTNKGIFDVGQLTQSDIGKIQAGNPFLTAARLQGAQQLNSIPGGQLFGSADVRSGSFTLPQQRQEGQQRESVTNRIRERIETQMIQTGLFPRLKLRRETGSPVLPGEFGTFTGQGQTQAPQITDPRQLGISPSFFTNLNVANEFPDFPQQLVRAGLTKDQLKVFVNDLTIMKNSGQSVNPNNALQQFLNFTAQAPNAQAGDFRNFLQTGQIPSATGGGQAEPQQFTQSQEFDIALNRLNETDRANLESAQRRGLLTPQQSSRFTAIQQGGQATGTGITGDQEPFPGIPGNLQDILNLFKPEETEEQKQQREQLKQSLNRLLEVEKQLGQEGILTPERQELQNQITEQQRRLNEITPEFILENQPGLKDVGITQPFLLMRAAQARDPIARGLSELIFSESILAQQQQQNVQRLQAESGTIQTGINIQKELANLGPQQQQLPEAIKTDILRRFLFPQDFAPDPVKISPGQTLVDPRTGDVIFQSPFDQAQQKPFSVAPGSTVFDPSTGQPIFTAPSQLKPPTELDTFNDENGNRILTVRNNDTGEIEQINLGKVGQKADISPKDGFNLELKLATDFEKFAKESRTALRAIDIINIGFNEAIKGLEEGKPLNAQSQAVIIGFNKLLDPTSVVRESEYARTPQGVSFLNRIDGAIIKFRQGGAGLNRVELEGIRDTAISLMQGYQQNQLNFAQRTQEQADKLSELTGGDFGDLERILTPDVIDVLNNLEDQTTESVNQFQSFIQDQENQGLPPLVILGNLVNQMRGSPVQKEIESLLEDPTITPSDIIDSLKKKDELSISNSGRRLADAIIQKESGGRFIAGASGEKGRFQFLISTFKIVSKEFNKVVNDKNKSLALNQKNEEKVARWKIQQLLNKGNSPRQVALIWNTSLGGSEKPLEKKGVNKQGVRFDSVAYANDVVSIFNKLS